MFFKKKFASIFTLLLTLGALILPQVGMTAEKVALRDIAIANLFNISDNKDLDQSGESITEMIFSQLAFSQKLSLVERSRLEDAMEEILLSDMGITDPKSAVKIGRAVGARYIFVGTITEFKGENVIIISTRLIEVENSRVISGWNESAAEANLSQVADKLANQIIGQLFPSSPASAALKSTIIPGWGQLSNGRSSGYLFIIGGLASAGGLVATQLSLSGAEDNLDALKEQAVRGGAPVSVIDLQAQTDTVDDKRSRRNLAAIVLGAVWGLNILDSYIETNMLVKSRQRAVQRTLAFEATPNLQGIVMRVRF